MINRGTSSLGSSLGDLQQPLERRQRRSAAVQTQPDQLHAGTTWPARKGVRKEPLPGPEDQGRALGKDDSVWGQNSGKFCSICLLLNTCVRLAHLLPVYTSALKLRFSKYDIAIVLYWACITSTWTITTSNNTNSNINPGLVLKQESKVASSQQNELIQALRHDRPPPPARFTGPTQPVTPSDVSGGSDDDEFGSNGNEHEGGGGDGSVGWQWRPFQQRKSHFRPWLAKSNKKHRGGLAGQWKQLQLKDEQC